MTVKIPPPAYPAIVAIALATVWLEDASPKRRKVFFARLRRAAERHRAGERPLRLERPPEEWEASEAAVTKAFAYIEAWAKKAEALLED